jgi:D-serine deaminase-like pyridoxal phosphate-dependent protein
MRASQPSKNGVAFTEVETPRLLLDIDRLERNAARMRQRCAELGVKLRPHLKTSKSLDVADVATHGEFGPVTVSTLKEAEYFAQAGYRDILYAVAITATKLQHVDKIQQTTGARILLLVDSVETAQAVAVRSRHSSTDLTCLIEVDCGEHRSGVPPIAEVVLPIAKILQEFARVTLEGVMTHAGHSYSSADQLIIQDTAEVERRSAVDAAQILRAEGFACPIVSVGSTPTILFARHLEGVTEARCGIYMFWDLAQLSRNICSQEDIAVSVLACVIGHNRNASSLVVDAGALALSKDIGANAHLPDAKYGYVCDAQTLKRFGTLSVDVVHQEHGTIRVSDPEWFERLPIGSLVRILPNHACLTCAAYDHYDVTRDGTIFDRWPRINGW